jgi:cysteine desulfurase family protein (TIGR01976 family)
VNLKNKVNKVSALFLSAPASAGALDRCIKYLIVETKMSEFMVDQVREMFPALISKDGQQPLIYLDNPGGTQVPHTVIDAIGQAMASASSNLGGVFPSSIRADEIWQSSHEAMADMLGASSIREIVIGPSMTTLTLHISRSLGRTFNRGDEIIVTRMDHEGDVSPWLLLAEDLGLVIKWLPFNPDTWQIESDDLKALLTDRTRLLALNYASNLTGSVNNISELASVAHSAGALVYVDAVQLAPHRLVSVNELGCDFLACSSYKFYGPHLGILWGRETVLADLEAYRCRCSSDDLAVRFETGTPQTELLAGLESTVEYFKWLGELCGYSGSRREKIAGAISAATEYENKLTLKLIEGLNEIKGLQIHGITDSARIDDRVPTVSFTHASFPPIEIAKKLAQKNICAWSGHNYAYEVVKQLGIDEEQGVLRLGIAQYNTENEIDQTLEALTDLLG